MTSRGISEVYFGSLPEVEEELGLPLLGALDAEPRFYQLQEVLASLAPDPRFSERLYRFVEAALLRVWVVGLGDAGEENPVAVGIAERAAVVSRAPVLLARLRDPMPDAARRPGLRPVRVPAALDATLATLFPQGCGALPSGIQSVFRLWEVPSVGGDPLEAGGLVVAGAGHEEMRRPSPRELSGVVLVVPFRDQPRDRMVAEVSALREAGYPLIGFVGFGLLGAAPGKDEEAERTRVAVTPERALAPPVRAVPVAPELADESRPPAPVTIGESDGEVAPAAVPAAGDGISITRSWAELYGPRRRRGRDGLRIHWGWLLALLCVLGLALVALFGRQHLRSRPGHTAAPAGAPGRPAQTAASVPSEPERAGADEARYAATSGGTVGEEGAESALPGEINLESDTAPDAGHETPAEPSSRPASEVSLRATSETAEGYAVEVLSEPEAGSETHAESGTQVETGTHTEPGTQAETGTAPAITGAATDAAAEIAKGEGIAPAAETAAGEGITPAEGTLHGEDAGPETDPGFSGGLSVPPEVGPAAGAPARGAPEIATPSPGGSATGASGIRDLEASYAAPYAILCGSFQSAMRAESELSRLQALGLDAQILVVRIPERGTWHRVVVDRGLERPQARQVAQAIVDSGSVGAAQVIARDGWGLPVPPSIARAVPGQER